jgi:hypothetical protein
VGRTWLARKKASSIDSIASINQITREKRSLKFLYISLKKVRVVPTCSRGSSCAHYTLANLLINYTPTKVFAAVCIAYTCSHRVPSRDESYIFAQINTQTLHWLVFQGCEMRISGCFDTKLMKLDHKECSELHFLVKLQTILARNEKVHFEEQFLKLLSVRSTKNTPISHPVRS